MPKILGGSFENLCFFIRMKLRTTQNQIPNDGAKICLWKIILVTSLYLDKEKFVLQVKLILSLKDLGRKYRMNLMQYNNEPLWLKYQRLHSQCSVLVVCILQMSP